MSIKLFKHQEEALELTKDFNRVAYFHDMGLGKTFTGAEKAMSFSKNILVVCQKSKVSDWVNHFLQYYTSDKFPYMACDLTTKKGIETFLYDISCNYDFNVIGIINYDLIFRRPELTQLKGFTLMLDESSMIQNEKSKRAKFILTKLQPTNVILLSGTPINGRYEKIWSQCHLLGWSISKTMFERHYCVKDFIYNRYGEKVLGPSGFPITHIVGYKNVDRLKSKLREYGAHFLKTEDVLTLPEQNFQTIMIDTTSEYKKFVKNSIVTINDMKLVGDTSLTKQLYQRMLCSQYNKNKLTAFEDLINSTEDRLVVFYSFNDELYALKEIADANGKPISEVNGHTKDLENYNNCENSITFVQYQAGAKGLNLQLANKIIYFSPTLMCEDWMQSKKRIHRIGQKNTCFYYILKCKNSIEEKIYESLEKGQNYTLSLFEEDYS